MSIDLTPQQRRAVEHRGTSVVLASGAGCGKTHVLTRRYVSHLVADGAEVGRVVAITFTDRAAREMRDRIRGEVEKLPDPGRHLRALDAAPITTIHGFCGTLLRQFAVPAGLDPGFEVLDDVLSANIRTEALQGSLRGLLEVPAGAADPASPAAALRELVVLFGWPSVVEAVDGLLLTVDRPAWSAWLARSPGDIAAGWVGPVRRGLLPGWVEYLAAASPKVAGCLGLLARMWGGSPGVAAKRDRLLAGLPGLAGSPDLAAAVEELCGLAKVQGTPKKDWPDEALYEAVKDAFTDFRADLPKKLATFAGTPADVAAAARVGQLFLRVAVAADDAYAFRKRRAGVLDFQDLLVMARDLLRDHAEVRAAVRGRYRFVLLDELQDTDPVQMELVDLLLGAGKEHGGLFAVGDHKQSIYRFRGAEVGLFRDLRRAVHPDGRLGLTRNYRSRPGVIRFVNALFSRRVPDYEPLDADRPAEGDAANVEFLWSVPADPSRESVADIRSREAEAIAGRIEELLNDPTPRVADRGGEPRRVERRDIVFLFRSMSHVATYEAALRRHGLDYYLVGGRAFFAQQEVYDLLNLLRAVENPEDAASLVGALRSPFCCLSDEAVFLLAAHPDGPRAGLNDPERVASLPDDQQPVADRAKQWLTKWRAEKDRLPLARLLNTVIADSGYDAALQFEFLGDRKLANLWKLVDLARSFDRSGLFGLPEFVARLADLIARQPREEQAATLPETADVVKLMSIHQAKGLEFPVVFVPDLAAAGRGDRHPVARWHRGLGCLVRLPSEFEDREDDPPPFPDFADRLGRVSDQLADWQEDLRVLYVACTRARDLLVLSAGLPEPFGDPVGGATPMPPKAATHWTLALAERFDLRTGRCVADDVKPEDVPAVRVTVAEPHEPASGGLTLPARHGLARRPPPRPGTARPRRAGRHPGRAVGHRGRRRPRRLAAPPRAARAGVARRGRPVGRPRPVGLRRRGRVGATVGRRRRRGRPADEAPAVRRVRGPGGPGGRRRAAPRHRVPGRPRGVRRRVLTLPP
ncbi:MAG: UvrD-helicase domain-containing protein [Gemmataceae bacterium]|nr:UvrD-helicase domain-containing protein [Gemmataceae bacterium]